MYVFHLHIEGGILEILEIFNIFGRSNYNFCTLWRQYCVGVLINRTNRIQRYFLYLNFFRSPTLMSQEASKLSTDVQKHANLCTVQCPPVQEHKEGGELKGVF